MCVCACACVRCEYHFSTSLQSDPLIEISKAQEGGTFTVVYRSQPIMKTLNPRWVDLAALRSPDPLPLTMLDLQTEQRKASPDFHQCYTIVSGREPGYEATTYISRLVNVYSMVRESEQSAVAESNPGSLV